MLLNLIGIALLTAVALMYAYAAILPERWIAEETKALELLLGPEGDAQKYAERQHRVMLRIAGAVCAFVLAGAALSMLARL